MATQTLGTVATNTLTAVTYSASLTDADIATIDGLIVDDQNFVQNNLGPGATSLQAGIVMSGTTSSTVNPTIITSVTVSSPSTAPLAGIVGSWVYGAGIPAGARVVSVSGTSVTISANCTASATVTFFAIGTRLDGSFARAGQLFVPNRGALKILPGDVIAVGAAGEVILVPKQAIAYSGSSWTLH